MKRVLTGIQSSGVPHLGNLIGAIKPAIAAAATRREAAFFFIADLHTLTSQKEVAQRQYYTQATAAAWLACGIDVEKDLFYRQSRVPAACELMWYLSCLAPYSLLTKAHAFKEKSKQLSDVNAGLFTYPLLMAADILLYQATDVPVGPDQQQHLEVARLLARSFNRQYGDLFLVPRASISKKTPVVPGTDGRKMSKSYKNTLCVFLPEKELKKTIMAIPTDSKPLAAPKDPEACTVFALYRLVAPAREVEEVRAAYLAGGYGYGTAKKRLLEAVLEGFKEERAAYDRYMADLGLLEEQLQRGERKARLIAGSRLETIRDAIGYTPFVKGKPLADLGPFALL